MCYDFLILQVEECCSYDIWPINIALYDPSVCALIFWPIYSRWDGEGVNEVGKDKNTGEVRVKVNPKFYRPTEVVRVTSLCSVCHTHL